jgi:DNA-binding response OmpR family regulator
VEKTTVLLVEDEPQILELNREMLEELDFRVLTAKNLSQARDVLSNDKPDVAVLDIMLPDGSGLDLLRELRNGNCSLPVLLLTAQGKTENIVDGLNLGADDYLPKPYEMEILAARVSALARRGKLFSSRVRLGSLELDTLAARAFAGGKDLNLTQKEFSLLLALAQNEGRYLSAEALFLSVWGYHAEGDIRALWKHMSNLKSKLDALGGILVLQGARGEGYRLLRTGQTDSPE